MVLKGIKQAYNIDIFTPLNQSLQPTGNFDILNDPRPWQMKRRWLRKEKEVIFFRDKREKTTPMFKQFEFVLR